MRPLPPQLVVVLLALVLAALFSATSLAGLAASYLCAWAALELALAAGVRLPRMSTRRRVAFSIAVLTLPLTLLGRRAPEFLEHEGLLGVADALEDRLRLERDVAIHPPLLRLDHPQTFFVHARGAARVQLAIAPIGAPIPATPLGHDLFRIDYDPRQDEACDGPRVEARIDVDGVIHTRSLALIRPVAHPRWLRTAPDRRHACATSEETDALLRIDERGRLLSTATLDGPSDCAFAGPYVAVAHRYAPALTLHTESGPPRELPLPIAFAHRLAADGTRLAVAHEDGSLRVVDVVDGQLLAEGHLGGQADWVAWVDGALIAARRAPAAVLRLVLDGARLRVERERRLLAPAVTLAAGTGQVVLAVTDFADTEAPAPHLGNHFVQDQLVALDARSLEVLRRVPTAQRSPRQDAAGGLDRGLSPLGVDVLPDGRWLVAFAGSDELGVLAPGDGMPTFVDLAPHGLSAPHGAVALADDTWLVSSPSSGAIARLDARGRLLRREAVAPSDRDLLATDPEALRRRYGERAFYEGTRAGIACQSCHLHAESDHLLHNIGGRMLAATLDVRGVAGTAPYLRDGSYPRLRDLHDVARTLYRGYRLPAGDRGATLEAFLASLAPPPSVRPRDPEREGRGHDAFVRAGCTECHGGPAFSHLGLHATRYVFPGSAPPGHAVDTPSLRGVGRRARLLHDGRVGSLDALFTPAVEDRHGHAELLSPSERADLVVFLESL